MEQTVETPVADTFDAAVTSESTYVEPKESSDRDDKGRFAGNKAAAPADDITTETSGEKLAADAKPAEKKPRNDPQARIDQAIARQRDAERRAEDAERRAREVEARQAAAQPRREEQQAAQPHVERFPNYENFLKTNPEASLEDWMDARDEWRDSRRDAAQRAQAESSRVETTFAQKVSAVGERLQQAFPTKEALEERVDGRLLGVRPYSLLTNEDKAAIKSIADPQERNAVAFRCFLADQWIDSEHAAALLEHLSDPAEFQRLATLPPKEVIRDIARFEAGLSAASGKERGSAQRPSASQARPPIKPLGTTPHAGADDDGSDEEPVESHIRRENARDRKAGRL